MSPETSPTKVESESQPTDLGVEQVNSAAFRIMDLPYELRHEILKVAIAHPKPPVHIKAGDYEARSPYCGDFTQWIGPALSLSRTCREFRSFIFSQKYRYILLGDDDTAAPPGPQVKQFLKLLEAVPAIRPCINELRVTFVSTIERIVRGLQERHMAVLYSTTDELPNLETLRVYGSCGTNPSLVWKWLSKCCQHMSKLNTVQFLTYRRETLKLEDIILTFGKASSLRVLSLEGIAPTLNPETTQVSSVFFWFFLCILDGQ